MPIQPFQDKIKEILDLHCRNILNSFAIHAHFYQPPREDPLTGFVPIEPNAAPYVNWNERIHIECYRPNANLGNFKQISFNIGPTLFDWMEKFDPHACQKIVEQDRANLNRHGCGNAIAQAYNHTILPLDTYETKVTQVYWGIADFAHRFQRRPAGIWLPETAVDLETLQVLSQFGLKFTILAPWQAEHSSLDANQPYRVLLADHREINVFFYQQELSAKVSFEPQITTNADLFAREILANYFLPEHKHSRHNQIVLIASDGELYGHHQKQREHFLARLVDGASQSVKLQPTYLERWLSQNPAEEAIRIRERTSWSCHHGIGRWTGTCSCTPGDRNWKAYLRSSMDRLARDIDQLYIDETRFLIKDPWTLRNRYIHTMLGQIKFADLLDETKRRFLTKTEERFIHLLLEAQRERQRMFTSCGWFFEDFDRIEPRNNVAYAAQAVWLIRMATGLDFEAQTAADLQKVTSQYTGVSAAEIFDRHLRRAEGVSDVRIGFED